MERKTKVFYIVLGDGRLASQLCEYFKSQQQEFVQWSRKKSTCSLAELYESCPAATCLLALSDLAIAPVAQTLSALGFHDLVHFSGLAQIEGVKAFHPLMTFTSQVKSSDGFEEITFVGPQSREIFEKTFPQFKNRYFEIKESERALYHANCVLSGNFANLLWRSTLNDFKKMGLPAESLKTYVLAVVEAFFSNPEFSLTGPLVRGDWPTIEKNLAALQNDYRSQIYLEFLKEFAPKSSTRQGVLSEQT